VTDRELLEKARAGDDKAFEELVKRYEPQVAATVIGMLGPGPAAEDVGQEVFIRFYRALRKFREESSVGTYVTRIAINLSLNELKRRKRNRLLLQKHDAVPQGDVLEEQLARNESQALVHHGLTRLEPRFRAVVVLRLLDGYSTEETARILKVPLGTVLSRLSRAQKKLKEILMPLMQEET